MDQQEKLRQIAKITAQIGGLPKGYISKKQINGKVYYYHQWSQSGVKHSKYLRDNEIEPLADAILVGFDVQAQAYMDIISGNFEPSGLLPLQLPVSMDAVEKHCEDKPRDIECYRDADNHVYDFAFGMNWQGVIDDERTRKYK